MTYFPFPLSVTYPCHLISSTFGFSTALVLRDGCPSNQYGGLISTATPEGLVLVTKEEHPGANYEIPFPKPQTNLILV